MIEIKFDVDSYIKQMRIFFSININDKLWDPQKQEVVTPQTNE